MSVVSHRIHWWLLVVLGLALAATEWLRQPGLAPVSAIWVAVAGGVFALRPINTRTRGLALLALAALAIVVSLQYRRLRAIDREWPRIREALINGAESALREELGVTTDSTERRQPRGTEGEADRVLAVARSAAAQNREVAFDRLARAVSLENAELGIAILDSSNSPYAWAGRFRIEPLASGDSLQVRSNTFYVVLETRQRVEGGRVAVASLLLWAAASAPDRSHSLAERFRRKTGVGLAIYPGASAPSGIEVFEYSQPTTAGRRLLFTAQPLPPEQGTSKEAALATAGFVVALLLLLVLALGVLVETSALGRLLIVFAVLWVFVRAPTGEFLGIPSWFSSATFFRSLLGPLSSSAGVLAIASALVTLGGIALWRKRVPVRWFTAIIGAGLLLVAPYVMRELGRGITPPANGVPLALWLTWQVTLLLATAGPIVLAAALFRGQARIEVTPPAVWIGAAVAVAASIAGVFVWGPRIGWPPWYTFLWTPALFLVTRPAPRRGAIAGIAVVAGCAAALITWGAVLEGRLNVARKDVGSLGAAPDPLAIRMLELFGQDVELGPPPAIGSELYALWRNSPLGEEEYPTQLGLWSDSGNQVVEVLLDSLDVSLSLISNLIRNLDSSRTQETIQVLRTPGVHSILLQRVGPGSVMSVVIGPKTRLIVPARLGRLLHRHSEDVPLYALSLSQPTPGESVDSVRLRWYRDGWRVRGDRQLVLPDGVRHVHASVDLRGPVPIFVRAALVVMLDILILSALWMLAEALVGHRFRFPAWTRLRRSYQFRLAVTLGFFFVLPAAGFAAWGFVRLRAEDDRARDLVISQSLRDAVLAAGSLGQDSDEREYEALLQLSRRTDAELGLYDGGVLVGSSAPVLEDIGIIPPLVEPSAFLRLTLGDELDVTSDGPLSEPPVRMGYRVVRPGRPENVGVLSTPQPAVDPELGEEQADLVLVLLLATLIGAGCAVAGAQVASRSLSRPVADLRRSALALGQGRSAEPPAQVPPVEFEEVFGAFGRMAADIRSSQAALEDARRRTAAVLANVATGVIALDTGGRVLIANRRAEEILGIAVSEGDLLETRLAPEWLPLTEAVREGTANTGELPSREVDAGGRRIRLQLARLESGLRGVVVALNDLTDVTRAERVLAWGEMARQVAHEIKNPLTPLRLGVQHLLRVYRDRRPDFERTLEDTSARILAEIDRLDTIARAFSRFGAPADAVAPLEPVDLTATATEVVQLYGLAEEGAHVELSANGPVWSVARRDEVKEVLVNLLENARNAGANRIQVTVTPGIIVIEDDGAGISSDQLPRIFEPRFSTTTSGSGLGLSIVRRLVESWNGSIEVVSRLGQGTRVTIAMPEPGP
jgi:two-component system, NtrC family, nitrogen regulation sensor histidine kinase NtrY